MTSAEFKELQTMRKIKVRRAGNAQSGIDKIKSILNRMWALEEIDFQFLIEYKFNNDRKFRFDFAYPQGKIAIEFEGIVSTKSRHTSITGFSRDCQKYNLAAIDGWIVLRYTALNIDDVHDDILKLNKKYQLTI